MSDDDEYTIQDYFDSKVDFKKLYYSRTPEFLLEEICQAMKSIRNIEKMRWIEAFEGLKNK